MGYARSFFYWGEVPLEDEVDDDVRAALLQPRRSMFYNRGYGCDLTSYENSPVSFLTQVQLKYEAVRALANRNSVVTDGSSGPDRRAATSQSIIEVEPAKDGAGYDMSVNYVMLSDMSRPRNASIPVGG